MKKNLFFYIGQSDIWLTVFFGVMLINMCFSLIFPLPPDAEKAGLDVAARTAIAVLAGYFVSKGFSEKKRESLPLKKKKRQNYQTLTIAITGVVSLSIMLAVRYSDDLNFSAAAVSQIRDLYLASLAFLMGTD